MKLIHYKRIRGIALSGALLMALLSSCEYEYVQQPDLPPIVTELSLQSDVMPIFNQRCNMSGCHAAGAVPPDLSPANAHADLMNRNMIDVQNPTNSILYKSITVGSMKSFATPAQAQVILTWIQQGAKNN